MPEQPKDPAPAAAAKLAYTIINQKHNRWWKVRDSEGGDRHREGDYLRLSSSFVGAGEANSVRLAHPPLCRSGKPGVSDDLLINALYKPAQGVIYNERNDVLELLGAPSELYTIENFDSVSF